MTLPWYEDGNLEHVAHAWKKICLFEWKKNPIDDYFPSYQRPYNQITEIAHYVRTYFWVNSYYKDHGPPYHESIQKSYLHASEREFLMVRDIRTASRT